MEHTIDVILRYAGVIWAAIATIAYLRKENDILKMEARLDKRFDQVESRVDINSTKITSSGKRVDRVYDRLLFSDQDEQTGYTVLFDETE